MLRRAREALDKFKMKAIGEVGVNLKQGYNGDLTSREVGSVGGQMVKKMLPVRTMSGLAARRKGTGRWLHISVGWGYNRRLVRNNDVRKITRRGLAL